MNVGKREVAASGVAHKVLWDVAVAFRLAQKHKSASAWRCGGRRRHELPRAYTKLAVDESVVCF